MPQEFIETFLVSRALTGDDGSRVVYGNTNIVTLDFIGVRIWRRWTPYRQNLSIKDRAGNRNTHVWSLKLQTRGLNFRGQFILVAQLGHMSFAMCFLLSLTGKKNTVSQVPRDIKEDTATYRERPVVYLKEKSALYYLKQ